MISWAAKLEEELDELDVPAYISNINGRKVVRIEIGSNKAIEVEPWGETFYVTLSEYDETGGLLAATDREATNESELAEIVLSIYSEFE